MSRVINLNSPGKERNQLMRTAAEIIRHLSQKHSLDDDVRNMVATLVYCFRQIDRGIDTSVEAWEKRDYWLKAERFRSSWSWVHKAANDLENLIRDEAWEKLPPTLVALLPHFEDIKIARFTRNPDLWDGAYERLMREATP
jgi:hypothetical protein